MRGTTEWSTNERVRIGSAPDELLHERVRIGSAPDELLHERVRIRNPYLFRICCAVQVDAVTDPFCGSVPDLVVLPGRIRSGVILLSGYQPISHL